MLDASGQVSSEIRRGFLFGAGALLAVSLGYAIYAGRSVLLVLFLSVIAAEAIAPIVEVLRRRGINLIAAVLSVETAIALACGLIIWRIEQTLGTNISDVLNALEQFQSQLQNAAAAVSGPFIRDIFTGLAGAVTRLVVTLTASSPRQSASELRTLGTVGFTLLATFVFAFYWLCERQSAEDLVVRLVAPSRRSAVKNFWDEVERRWGAWVRGEVLLMLTIAVPFGIVLALAGVHYALVLALFAGIIGVVPVVGSIVGLAPAVLVALTNGVGVGATVLGFGLLIQLLEGIVVGPRLMRHLTGVSPLTVLAGIIFGAGVAGVAGAFVAVPLAAALQLVLTQLGTVSVDEPAAAASEPIAHPIHIDDVLINS